MRWQQLGMARREFLARTDDGMASGVLTTTPPRVGRYDRLGHGESRVYAGEEELGELERALDLMGLGRRA